MVAVPSTMLALGTKAPNFTLPDTTGRGDVSLADFDDSPVLMVMFICNHCPYVLHLRESISKITKQYQSRGVATVAISSNDTEKHPDDNPTKMGEEAQRSKYVFPYLYDETQEVAKAYKAACTPDLFVFDKERKLVYRGQWDGSRPGSNVPVTGEDICKALDNTLAGNPPLEDQNPSVGCNIKWKAGAAPSYFNQ